MVSGDCGFDYLVMFCACLGFGLLFVLVVLLRCVSYLFGLWLAWLDGLRILVWRLVSLLVFGVFAVL